MKKSRHYKIFVVSGGNEKILMVTSLSLLIQEKGRHGDLCVVTGGEIVKMTFWCDCKRENGRHGDIFFVTGRAKNRHDDIIVVYLTHFVVCICSFLWLLVITVYSCAMTWSRVGDKPFHQSYLCCLLLWRNHGLVFCDFIFWNENTAIIMIPLVPSHKYMSEEFFLLFYHCVWVCTVKSLI